MILAQDLPLACQVVADMSNWVDRAVIGLNLCPFAKSVVARGQLHWAVSTAATAPELLDDLDAELRGLMKVPVEQRDTTLLVAPDFMPDFLAFHAFLPRVDKCLRALQLEGVVQVASFHPEFEFAEQPPDALGHFTNRAPYPTLHLLRESSIDRAVEAFPDAEAIYGRNLETLARLGRAGWSALGVRRNVPVLGGDDLAAAAHAPGPVR
jgi:uncharacterized protein